MWSARIYFTGSIIRLIFCALFVVPHRTAVSKKLSFSDFKLSFAMKKLSCLGILSEFFRFLDLSFVKKFYVVYREETFSFLALIRSARCVNSL